MKVTQIKTHLVRSARGKRSPWVFVEVFTDEGVVGLGDATNWPGGAIIKKAIEDLSQFVIGEDPFHIEYLYHRMYRASIRSVRPERLLPRSAASRSRCGISKDRHSAFPYTNCLEANYETEYGLMDAGTDPP